MPCHAWFASNWCTRILRDCSGTCMGGWPTGIQSMHFCSMRHMRTFFLQTRYSQDSKYSSWILVLELPHAFAHLWLLSLLPVQLEVTKGSWLPTLTRDKIKTVTACSTCPAGCWSCESVLSCAILQKMKTLTSGGQKFMLLGADINLSATAWSAADRITKLTLRGQCGMVRFHPVLN